MCEYVHMCMGDGYFKIAFSCVSLKLIVNIYMNTESKGAKRLQKYENERASRVNVEEQKEQGENDMREIQSQIWHLSMCWHLDSNMHERKRMNVTHVQSHAHAYRRTEKNTNTHTYKEGATMTKAIQQIMSDLRIFFA